MDRADSDASDAPAEPTGSKHSRLDRIADLLGCPVETFTDGVPGDDTVGEAAELLRLWLAIPHLDGRAKVLALARKLAQS